MDESPQWLSDLGQAFQQQESQVMDTVQGLRRRAQTTGNLNSTEQQAVYQQGDAIVVQPRTQIVYVPYYDPYVVYGPWWWPYYRPVFWRPWAPRPVFVSAGFFYSSCDWSNRFVRVVHRPVHVAVVQQQAHVVPGKWQHRPTTVSAAVSQVRSAPPRPPTPMREFHRVPDSQRKPIAQSGQPRQQKSMPAANGFSRPQPQQQQRAQQQQREQARVSRTEPHREMRQQQPQRQWAGEQRGQQGQRGQQEQRGRRG